MRAWIVAFGLVGCNEAATIEQYRCDVRIAALSPSSGSPGEAVTVTGTPFTTSWDTAVYVGGTRALVDEVNRYDCDPCDECLDEHIDDCKARMCADCDVCDVLCTACTEVATFVVPDVAAGETSVRLLNSHGESNGMPFVVAAKPVDTGDSGNETGDSASPETGESGK
jgi:hypothetical protein